jgi:hypothetical protein
MKNLILTMLFLSVICVSVSVAQATISDTPTITLSRQVDFGGPSSSKGLFIDGDDYLISGTAYRQAKPGLWDRYAAFAKFSGTSGYDWVTLDTLGGESIQKGALMMNGGLIYSSNNSSGENRLTRRLLADGSLVWKHERNIMSLAAYGDTVLGVEISDHDPRVMIIDPMNGSTERTFLVNGRVVDGSVPFPNVRGNMLFLTAKEGPLLAFHAKYDILSGKELWRLRYPLGLKCKSDVDDSGNTFLGLTILDALDTVGANHAEFRKVDSNSKEIWVQKWYMGKTYETNQETYTQAVAFSAKKNAAVIGGATQGRYSWLRIYNATSGNLFWERVWESPELNFSFSQMVDCGFDSNDDLVVLWNGGRAGPDTIINYIDRYSFNKLVTAVPENDYSPLPTSYSLDQNYPNPFNPSTTIEFKLPKSGFVNLTVYNTIGQEVRILVNEELGTGTHRVNWIAEHLPSGIYFYRLTTSNFVATKKMVLMK